MKISSKKLLIYISAVAVAAMFTLSSFREEEQYTAEELRALYMQDPKYWPKPFVDKEAVFKELAAFPKAPLSRFDKDSTDQAFIDLGKTLFHDPRLSQSNQISCASCHKPDLHWSDGTRFATGHDHQTTTRHTPSIENVWAGKSFFWDGRAKTLEEQALGSISNPKEMNQDPEKLPKKLAKIKGYKPYFKAAFGSTEITVERILQAIALFEQTINSRPNAFDQFMNGDHKKLTDVQIQGLHLFRTKARCINCHNGPFFTDQSFHNIGLFYFGRDKYEDLGRYGITDNPGDVGKFKTPSLRNVMQTNPWFHNGLFPTMEGVLNMYNAGMPQPKLSPHPNGYPLPVMDPLIKKLDLTPEERTAIIAFLEALSSLPIREEMPVLPQ